MSLFSRGSALQPAFIGSAGFANLPNYRAALAAAKANSAGPLIINVVGDSTIVGGQDGGTIATSLPRKLGDQFATNAGLSVNGAEVIGTPLAVSAYGIYNPSVTPGGWAPNGAVQTAGGYAWGLASSGTNFSWTAEGRQFNRLVVYPITNSGLGTFRVKVDGSVVGTIDTNSAGGVGKVVYAVTLGTHTVELEWVSGSCFFSMLETMDTTAKNSARIRNLGWGGATSSNIADQSNPWNSGNALRAFEAAHLHIIEGGQVNDWLNSIGTATSGTNLASIASGLQTKGGDVLWLGATRSNTTTTPAATQQGYVDAMAALANGTTTIFYDLKTGVGDYAAMSAAGRMYDNLHPNAAGYAAEAAVVYPVIS